MELSSILDITLASSMTRSVWETVMGGRAQEGER